MTAPSTSSTTSPPTTFRFMAMPVLASITTFVIGILTLLEGVFHTGHLPPAVTVSEVFAGSGVTLGSAGAWLAHHFGWAKLLVNMPAGKAAELGYLDSHIEARVKAAMADLPGWAKGDVDAIAAKVRADLLAALTSSPAPAGQSSPPTAPPAPAAPPTGT